MTLELCGDELYSEDQDGFMAVENVCTLPVHPRPSPHSSGLVNGVIVSWRW